MKINKKQVATVCASIGFVLGYALNTQLSYFSVWGAKEYYGVALLFIINVILFTVFRE